MKQYLPKGQNVILIGDISEGDRVKMFIVKGIEFIDSNMSSSKDLEIVAKACCSFRNGFERKKLWNITNVDINDTILTPNFIDNLINNCYTVSNPALVRQKYDEWKQYIEFRNYYLEEQAKSNFLLDSCEYIESYAVNKSEYKINRSIYDDYILNNEEEFTKGDMIILSSKVENAELFPLIRLNIDRNKQELYKEVVNKKGKDIPKEETKIYSLARDNVLITTIDPNTKGNEKKPSISNMLNNGYALGERFKIIKKDILPEEHLAQLEKEHDNEINNQYKVIDDKYNKIINNQLKDSAKTYKASLTKEYNDKVAEYKKGLEETLEKDVLENQDKNIIKKINELKKSIKLDIEKNNKKSKDETKTEYEERINPLIQEAYANIDIKALYIDRNQETLDKYSKDLKNELNQKVEEFKEKEIIKLRNKYSDDIRNEKIKIKEELDLKLKNVQEKVKNEETITRYSLYFRLGDINNNITDKQIDKISECEYIVYDSRAEYAKIKRQTTALENFYSGYVKNPYLSTYLFDSDKLENNLYIEPTNWVWYLESLNEKQKEAVRKAVASNGIFLLQGPPGTGKTQVIAETVAQMVKLGKKVLISSETHKAIDNVFERLPKIADIVPVRLIPSYNKKNNNEYDPSCLVDNLYKNISDNMIKQIHKYENFKQMQEEFDAKFKELQLLKAKLAKQKDQIYKIKKESSDLDFEAKKKSKQLSIYNQQHDDYLMKKEVLARTQRHIEKNNFKLDDDIDSDTIFNLKEALTELFSDECFASDDVEKLVKNIMNIQPKDIDNELEIINPNSTNLNLEIRKQEIQARLKEIRDELGDAKPGYEEEEKVLKSELRDIINSKNDNANNLDMSTLKLGQIFKMSYITEKMDLIKDDIYKLNEEINNIKSEYLSKIYELLYDNEQKLDNINEKITNQRTIIKGINKKIQDNNDSDFVQEYNRDKNKLEKSIDDFFKEFEIAEPYTNIDEALDIIKNKYQENNKNFNLNKETNSKKINMFKKISDYLSSEDIIEADRKEYTKSLFDSANVFGITCTSNDRFSGDNINSLEEYGIDDIAINNVGIDVVIIDEVSKSSFIDLLIPILYGKTVILVGDHRQLPPMYEFAKLKEADFEGLDEDIINLDINKKFTNMYEECIFKTLFEKTPDNYKTMLVQQYRCHEHIMNVFNHFYQGQLQLGFAGQNNQKNHNIRLISNGRTIIEPDKHIYFVDCESKETHESDSTSMFNMGEVEVIVELIKKLNDYFKTNNDLDKLSIGVICTYGDQAAKIKARLKSEKVKTNAFKTDIENMIVSTVDDFQGDERDIIILSTVRNPENPARSNPGFILAYQRINVALSRARRMLIMVGNRKYLESKGVIDLPDINGMGNDRKDFKVYEEILHTIELYGKVLEDVDIINEEARING